MIKVRVCMYIADIINLLKTNKLITILTPNFIESKLLYDRLRLSSNDVKIINAEMLEINNATIYFATPHTVYPSNKYCSNSSHVIVEFPNSIPESVFSKLPFSNLSFVNSEIV